MQEKTLPTPVTPDNPVIHNQGSETVENNEVARQPTVATPEKMSTAGDRVNQSGPAQQVVPSVNLPQPIAPATAVVSSSDDNNIQASDSNPAVADDVDVIEKVWVQKAKSIVSQTKSDPHKQEDEVSKLQTDYQMKRFGKSASDE